MVAGALADEDGLAQSVRDLGGGNAAVAVKHAVAGRAHATGQAIGAAASAGAGPAGVVKAFLPAIAADVVAVRHGGKDVR